MSRQFKRIFELPWLRNWVQSGLHLLVGVAMLASSLAWMPAQAAFQSSAKTPQPTQITPDATATPIDAVTQTPLITETPAPIENTPTITATATLTETLPPPQATPTISVTATSLPPTLFPEPTQVFSDTLAPPVAIPSEPPTTITPAGGVALG